jgi:hypothetical protein
VANFRVAKKCLCVRDSQTKAVSEISAFQLEMSDSHFLFSSSAILSSCLTHPQASLLIYPCAAPYALSRVVTCAHSLFITCPFWGRQYRCHQVQSAPEPVLRGFKRKKSPRTKGPLSRAPSPPPQRMTTYAKDVMFGHVMATNSAFEGSTICGPQVALSP